MKTDSSDKNDCYETALCFVNLIKDHYSFLNISNNYHFEYGQYDYKTKKLKNISKPLYPWFNIRIQIIFERYEINISYGDREFIILPTFKTKDGEYGFWEILKANGIEHSNVFNSQFIFDTIKMSDTIQKQAMLFKENIEYFLNIDNKIVKIITTNRADAKNEWLQNIKEQEFLAAYHKARDLFKNKKYNEAMNMIEVYKEYFNRSQKIFYDLCKKKNGDRPTTAST